MTQDKGKRTTTTTAARTAGTAAAETGPGTGTAPQDRAEALIARIDADTAAELDRLRARAEAEGAELVRTAHGRARHRVHGEIEAMRRARAEALRFEEARLDTTRRQLRQREAATVIAAGLPEVAAALTELWSDKGARRAWAEALVRAAARRAPGTGWVIAHPKGWAAAEKTAIAAEVEALTGQAPGFEVDPALTAGLRIEIGAVTFDASPEALMADEAALGAALQAELLAADREAADAAAKTAAENKEATP